MIWKKKAIVLIIWALSSSKDNFRSSISFCIYFFKTVIAFISISFQAILFNS